VSDPGGPWTSVHESVGRATPGVLGVPVRCDGGFAGVIWGLPLRGSIASRRRAGLRALGSVAVAWGLGRRQEDARSRALGLSPRGRARGPVPMRVDFGPAEEASGRTFTFRVCERRWLGRWRHRLGSAGHYRSLHRGRACGSSKGTRPRAGLRAFLYRRCVAARWRHRMSASVVECRSNLWLWS